MSGISNDTIGKVVNLASDKECTVIDLAKAIIKITDSKSEIIHMPALEGDPKRNPADISRAHELIGYKTSYSLEMGLKETVQHLLE